MKKILTTDMRGAFVIREILHQTLRIAKAYKAQSACAKLLSFSPHYYY